MATNTNPFYTYSATAGSSKTLQKPQDGGDNNQWGNYINTDLDEIVSAVNALSDKIADASENTLVDFTATGSAVNHVGITNAATGNPPQISSAGSDTNVDLTLTAKGTGDINLTPGTNGDVNIPASKGITFGDDGEKIEGDGTDLTIASSATLNVNTGSASGNDLKVNTSQLVVEGDTGNVGIGTTPSAKFHLATNSEGSSIPTWYEYSDANAIISNGDGGKAEGYVKFQTGQYNTASTNNLDLIIQNKDNNYDAGFRITAGGGTGTTTNNGYFSINRISTNGSAISATERFRIDSSGSITTPNGEFNGTIGDSAAFPAGSVLRIHSTSTTTQLNNFSGATYVDGITITISNPVSASSKFLIQNTAGGLVNNCDYIIVRVTRTVGATTTILGSHISFHNRNENWNGTIMFPISVQDEPSTTSAITYKVQVYADQNSAQVYWNYAGGGGFNNKTFLNVIEYQG